MVFQNLFLFILCILQRIVFSEIIFAFENFRHGSRGPCFETPKNMTGYRDKYGVFWEKNNGGLTGIGMRMEYLIGVRNKDRYSGLISKIFDPKEILIYSSTFSRTIISAEAQLQGMFPPKTGAELSKEELKKAIPPNKLSKEVEEEIKRLGSSALPNKVQLIPIHVFEQTEFEHLVADPTFCPVLSELKEKWKKKDVFSQFYQKLNSTFGIQLMKYFQINDSRFLFDYYRVLFLADEFVSDYDNDRDLSSFEKTGINLKEYYDMCIEFQDLMLFKVESNEIISAMAVTPSMKRLISWMDKRIVCDEDPNCIPNYDEPKFVMYSGHDTTMAPFQLFMKLAFNISLEHPHFGSNMFYELHRNDTDSDFPRENNDYYVEYYYNDKLLLQLPYDTFKRRVERLLWSEERILQFCEKPLEGKLVLVVIGGMIIVIFTLFVTISVLCFNQTSGRKRERLRTVKSTQNFMQELI